MSKKSEMAETNNFDALRLGAALLVMASHSYPMTGAGSDPVTRIFPGISGGDMAVAAFFVISGFLVTISAGRRSPFDFVRARLIRILPALIAVTLFAVLIVGPIFTTLPLASYATSRGTVAYLGNAYVFGLQFRLPGTFAGLPVQGSVNGSLWTLPLEVAMYAILMVLTASGLRTRRGSLGVALLFVAAFAISATYYGLGWNNRGPMLFSNVQVYPFLRYAIFFFIGAALSFWLEWIPLRWPAALGVAATWVVSAHFNLFYPIFFLALPYLVIYIAMALPAVDLRKIGDLSYGTYLFAFPIQQSVVQIFGKGIGPWGLMATATPIVLAVAFISWRWLEKPALGWKMKSLRRFQVAEAET